MPAQYSRADALREYLTGALSDGALQADPSLSLGHYRSSIEAKSLGITILNPITGVAILYAGGANPVGNGILTAVDANHLTWQPAGLSVPGDPVSFSGVADTQILEAYNNGGQYLRIAGTTPFTPGQSTITLAYIPNNVFGFDNVDIATAGIGVTQYRATIVRNESTNSVSSFQRWTATLGTKQVSDGMQLGVSGSGSIVTTGTFADWPSSGWAQIRTSTGSLREIIYYSSKTNTVLVVPAGGRGMLGSTPAAGLGSDVVYPTPGVAIGIDLAGVQVAGSPIQTIANQTTAPTGIIWNTGITPATGLQIGSLGVGSLVGIWMKRHIPAGVIATPSTVTQFLSNFSAL